MKVDTAKNIADMMAKCLSATVRELSATSAIARRDSSQALEGDGRTCKSILGIILLYALVVKARSS